MKPFAIITSITLLFASVACSRRTTADTTTTADLRIIRLDSTRVRLGHTVATLDSPTLTITRDSAGNPAIHLRARRASIATVTRDSITASRDTTTLRTTAHTTRRTTTATPTPHILQIIFILILIVLLAYRLIRPRPNF